MLNVKRIFAENKTYKNMLPKNINWKNCVLLLKESCCLRLCLILKKPESL